MSIRFPHFLILLAAATTAAFADTITFDPQCPTGQTQNGPCSTLFSTVGNAQSLSIPTAVGNVTISGGALFDDIANLPADHSAVYGTAGNGADIGVTTGTGFTNPLVITFPIPITSFSVDLFNGNTITVTYLLQDNVGDSSTFSLGNNSSGGTQAIGFANNATVVDISAITGQSPPGGMTWDFLIDNINFTPVPEPVSALLMGIGLVALGLAGRAGKWRKTASSVILLGAAGMGLTAPSSYAAAITLGCPAANGTVGVPYASSLGGSGGVSPYTFSITSGALPAGLTLTASTGAIAGTPSASGPATFTAKVVDSLLAGAGGSPDTTSAGCTITIAPAAAPLITSLNPPLVAVGGPAFLLTLIGSGFTPNAVVLWNGTPLATTYGNAGQLTAQVANSLITTPQYVTITVTANGATSNSETLTVSEIWQQILDTTTVQIGQISPDDADELTGDWNTGMVFVDFNELSRDGFSGGFIQVLEYDPSEPDEDGWWVVQNFPVETPNLLAGAGTNFGFAVVAAGPRNNVMIAAYHTKEAAPPPRGMNNGGGNHNNQQQFRPPQANPAVPQRPIVPVRPVPTSIGGLMIPPPENPPDPSTIMPIDPKMERTDSQAPLTNNDSVEQKRMECAPASVANSMQYLGVNDGANNQPSGNAGSRVGSLDRAMRTTNQGTSSLNILTGKQRYIAGANPSGRALPITMNSQGRFCPTASNAANCPGGQNGDSGATPTEPFITDALKAGKDVEVCFAWAATPFMPGPPPVAATPGGAHCVFITGYQFVNGFLELEATHDLLQGQNGGVGPGDGGHITLRVGIVNNQLWIPSFFGRPAQLTHVITEAMNNNN